MAEKKAKTAQKGNVSIERHACPNCGADSRGTTSRDSARARFLLGC